MLVGKAPPPRESGARGEFHRAWRPATLGATLGAAAARPSVVASRGPRRSRSRDAQ